MLELVLKKCKNPNNMKVYAIDLPRGAEVFRIQTTPGACWLYYEEAEVRTPKPADSTWYPFPEHNPDEDTWCLCRMCGRKSGLMAKWVGGMWLAENGGYLEDVSWYMEV